jgi:hypothetical protein
MAPFGLIEWNEMERNRVECNRMERNEINTPLLCLDVSGGMILNSFHSISFRTAPLHYYFSNLNNGTLLYSISFRSIPLYSINPNRALVFVKKKNLLQVTTFDYSYKKRLIF